jgi:hypothetical protein
MTRIRCYTLFRIKSTGVPNRRSPSDLPELQLKRWQESRNLQVNFDTILQVISLRGQPEDISAILTEQINFGEFNKFGFLYDNEEDKIVYSFDFSVSQKQVFDNGETALGALYSDCQDVPMIKFQDDWKNLSTSLDISPELKNIHFEVLSDE